MRRSRETPSAPWPYTTPRAALWWGERGTSRESRWTAGPPNRTTRRLPVDTGGLFIREQLERREDPATTNVGGAESPTRWMVVARLPQPAIVRCCSLDVRGRRRGAVGRLGVG